MGKYAEQISTTLLRLTCALLSVSTHRITAHRATLHKHGSNQAAWLKEAGEIKKVGTVVNYRKK